MRYSFRYIVTTTDRELASGEEMEKKAKEISPERSDFVDTIAQDYIERGREEELIETLITQLELKFNIQLSEDLKEGLKNAGIDKLKKIRDNIFNIEDIEEVEEIIEE